MVLNYNRLGRRRDTWLKNDVGDYYKSPPSRRNPRTFMSLVWLLLLIGFGLPKAFAQVSLYSFNQSSGTFTPLSAGTVVGTATSTNSLDSFNSVGITIPFTFNLGGTVHSTAFMNSNGYIALTASHSAFTTTPISTAGTGVTGVVSAWAGDLNTVFNIGGRTGTMQWGIVGTAPNREIVFEWRDFRPAFSSSTTNAFVFSFQIRLEETTNNVRIVYGSGQFLVGSTPQTGVTNRQIGLRGTTTADFNNRVFTSFASPSAPGTLNTSANSFNTSTNFPASGLTLTFSPPAPCSGTPTPGNTLTTANNVCAGTNFTLSLQNATTGSGVTYQWQNSPDNVTYTNISGATSATFVTSTLAPTWYRCVVSCSGSPANSNPLQILLNSNFQSCYNTNAATSTGDGEISNVTIGSLNNSSTCTTLAPGTGSILNRYSNYRGFVTPPDLQRSASVPFSLTMTSCGGSFGNGFQVYIDFNQNGFFEDSERVFNQPTAATGSQTQTGSFTVPLTALLGVTGMRVVNVEAGFPNSTNYANVTYSFGETEDYLVNITAEPACVSPQSLTLANIAPTSVTLNWTASISNPTGGYEYEIRTSGAAGSGTTGLAASGTVGAGVLTASVSGLTGNTIYNVFVRSNCDGNGFSTWFGPVTFTTPCLPATIPYSESFETAVIPNMPACVTSSHPLTRSTLATGAAPRTGTVFQNIRWTPTVTKYVYSAPLALTGGTSYDMGAWYLTDGLGGWSFIRLYVNTVPSPTGATLLTTVPNATNTTYQRIQGSFAPPSTGTYHFFIEVVHTGAPNDMSIDDMFAVVSPTCVEPTALQATTTNVSANLSWTAATIVPGNGYDYFVSTTNTPPTGSTTPTGNVTGTSVTIPNLTSGTQYFYWVRSNCSGSDQSTWASGGSFTTQIVAPAPYVEGFATTLLPTGYSANRYFVGTTVAGNPGNSIAANLYSSFPTADFRAINIGPVNAAQFLSFDYKFNDWSNATISTGTGNFVVQISTDFGVTYTNLETVPVDTNIAWRSKSYSLAPYANQIITLRILSTWTAGDFYIAFDNISVLTPCSGTPASATVLPTSQSICTTLPALPLVASNFEVASGISHQWEQSTDNGVTWVNAVGGSGANTTTYTPPNFAGVTIQYRMRTTCANSGLSSVSTVSEINSNSRPVPLNETFSDLNTLGGWAVTGGYAIGAQRGATGNPGNNAFSNLTSFNTANSLTTAKYGPVQAGMGLTFDLKLSNFSSPFAPPPAGWGQLVVSVSTDCGVTFTTIGTINDTPPAAYRTLTFPLSAFIGQGVSVRIAGTWTAGSYDVSIDNLKIDFIAPTVTGITAGTVCAAEGGSVTINGFGFTGTTAVTLNGSPVSSFTVNNDTTITAVIGGGAVSGPIAVTNSVGTGTSSTPLTITPNPVVSPITFVGEAVLCIGGTMDLDTTTPGGTWSSTNPAIITVDQDGIVTAVGDGSADIQYSVTDNGCTTTVSQTVLVNSPIQSTNPGNATVITGNTATFTVTATGDITAYQWQVSNDGGLTYTDVVNDVNTSGATTNTLTIANTSDTLNGNLYQVIITGVSPCANFTSAAATLAVGDTGIDQDPQSVSLCSTGAGVATFTVVGSGTVDSYVWFIDSGNQFEEVQDGPLGNTTISGATTNQLTISGITLANNGWRVVAQVVGPANGATSNEALLTVNEGVTITSSPSDAIACSSGGSDVLTATTTGNVASYQWQYATSPSGPWANVVNATPAGFTYTVTNTAGQSQLTVTTAPGTAAGVHYYQLIANGNAPCSPATSNVAQVTVTAPVVAIQSSGTVNCVPGSGVTLTATGASTYTWSPSSGLSATTGAVVTASPTATTTYTVTGTDANGCTATASVTITVGNSVTAIVSATPQNVCPGAAVQLNASGLTPFVTSPVSGYTFTASSGAALDPMTGATPIGAAPNDDTPYAATNIGFTFNFDGANFTQFSASPDGFIRMGGTTATSEFTNSFASITNNPKIAPFWDDLALGGTGLGGNVRTRTIGTAPNRICIVEWNVTIPRNTVGTANARFQLWMYETTNVVEFRYGAMGGTATMFASVGLRGNTTFNSVTVSNNTASTAVANDNNSVPASGTMYRFVPGGSPALTYAWTSVPAGFTSTLANPIANPTENTTYNVTVTTASGCTSTASVNVTVQSGASITAQPAPVTVCAGQPATFTVAAVGPTLTYQWRKDGVAITGNPSATTATLSLATTVAGDAGNYDVVVTPLCGDAVTSDAVVLTVNPLPVATPSANAVCAGGTLTLTANAPGAATYAWTGPNGFTSTSENPTIANVSAANNGVYTLVTTSALGCTSTSTVVVSINLPPTAITIAPSAATVCSVGPAQELTATGGIITVFSENFSNNAPGWTITNDPSSPAATNWTFVTSPHVVGFNTFTTLNGGGFAFSNPDAGGSGSVTDTKLTSPIFSTVGLTSATLSFEQFYQPYFEDAVVQVEISTNGGSSWVVLADYLGVQQGAANTSAPTTISLNSYLNQSNLRIRYNYVSAWGFRWFIDDIRVTGGQSPSWTPTAGLFTDAAATTPYTGGAAATVFALPTATTTYTASVTSLAGCTTTQTVAVNVTPAVTYYADADNDGFGNAAVSVVTCTPPAGFVANNTDCDDTKNTVRPNAPEIGYNLTDDDCDGLIDEGFPPIVSTINPTLCNTTLTAINQQIFSTLVAGAQGYQWRVTTISGPNVGQVQTLNTLLRVMRLTELPNFAYGATYQIEVAVRFQGFVQPYPGATCNVTTPLPVCQLVNCDQQLGNIQDAVFANLVPFATGYRFRITDPLNPANTQVLDRNLREFRMSQITAFSVQYNKTYNVEVAVRNTDGTYLPFGAACQVTTPLFPTTGLQDAQCDNGLGGAYEVPTLTTQIFANSWPGVIGYAFRLTGPGLPGGNAEVVKQLRVFTLSDFASFGLQPGAEYSVQVRLIFNANDAAGPYGKVCTIKVPGSARIKAVDFNAVAYPNPFAENFNIDLTTSQTEKVTVKVYDMAGRLLEERTATVSEAETNGLGDRYPAGVYNVIVSQGDEVKTLRVIKR